MEKCKNTCRHKDDPDFCHMIDCTKSDSVSLCPVTCNEPAEPHWCKSADCAKPEVRGKCKDTCRDHDLPNGVLDCGKSSSHYECNPCVGNQWYSKDTNGFVNAVEICKSQGYSGVIREYGGTRGINCKYSNDKKGGSLTEFGHTVSWKCEL